MKLFFVLAALTIAVSCSVLTYSAATGGDGRPSRIERLEARVKALEAAIGLTQPPTERSELERRRFPDPARDRIRTYTPSSEPYMPDEIHD